MPVIVYLRAKISMNDMAKNLESFKAFYTNSKVLFENLTGKEADKNLEAYMSFLNLMLQIEIKSKIENLKDSKTAEALDKQI